MCTATWYFTADGYELFFNRDELRTRAVARPPEPATTRQVRYLAPTDGEAGGTWLALSEFGLAVGLLNAHPMAVSLDGPVVSRGHLLRDLADLAQPSDLPDRLEAMDLQRIPPFTLFALSRVGRCEVIDYDGSTLSRRRLTEPALLSSSSIEAGGATVPRALELSRHLEGAADPASAHLAFHRSHQPARGPLSPCMHRPDARTVSFCHVQVNAERGTLAYVQGPPCRLATPSTLSLALSTGRAAGSSVNPSSRRG